MRFSTSAALAIAAISSTVYGAAVTTSSAQPTASVAPVDGGANPIVAPLGNEDIKAGEATTIKWTPTTGDTVTLILREGTDANDLGTLTTIAANVDNSGSFEWTPSADLVDAGDYSIQITSDRETSNYSPMFSIESDNKASSTSSSSTSTSTASSSTSTSTKTSTSTSSSAIITGSSHNSTATHSGTSSHASSTASPSTTGNASSTASGTPAATSGSADTMTGAASIQTSSPLALVLCFIVGVVYFN